MLFDISDKGLTSILRGQAIQATLEARAAQEEAEAVLNPGAPPRRRPLPPLIGLNLVGGLFLAVFVLVIAFKWTSAAVESTGSLPWVIGAVLAGSFALFRVHVAMRVMLAVVSFTCLARLGDLLTTEYQRQTTAELAGKLDEKARSEITDTVQAARVATSAVGGVRYDPRQAAHRTAFLDQLVKASEPKIAAALRTQDGYSRQVAAGLCSEVIKAELQPFDEGLRRKYEYGLYLVTPEPQADYGGGRARPSLVAAIKSVLPQLRHPGVIVQCSKTFDLGLSGGPE